MPEQPALGGNTDTMRHCEVNVFVHAVYYIIIWQRQPVLSASKMCITAPENVQQLVNSEGDGGHR